MQTRGYGVWYVWNLEIVKRVTYLLILIIILIIIADKVIKTPPMAESISEGTLSQWMKRESSFYKIN